MSDIKNKEKNSIVKYLTDLRKTLIHCIIVIVILFAILMPFADSIYNFIATPIINVIKDSNLIAIGVISPFLTPLKMTLIMAIYLTMPFILYKIWIFITPALYKHEKKLIMPLIISSTVLFYAGIFFSFYIVFPVIFNFLAIVGPSVVNFTPDIQYYLNFVIKVSFAFALAFEVPIATILLIMFGVTTTEKLKKNRSYIIIGSFLLAMILTPPDVISQILIAIPMWLLFETGLLIAPLFKIRKNENANKKTTYKPKTINWQDAEYNKKIDKIEKEMNKIGKQ